MGAALANGRLAFDRQAWGEANAQLAAADHEAPLGVDDLERMAVAAYLCGDDSGCATAWSRAHHECLRQLNSPRAARNAFWLAFGLLLRGEMAPAAGWLARAQRVLDDGGHECVERGFLLVPAALRQLLEGDSGAALAGFTEAMAIGRRFNDDDLTTLGRLGRGQSLVLGGQQAEGTAQLDEVMVAVAAGEVSPVVSGLVYCAVIDICQASFDLRRAREWTAALTRWCDTQPDLVPYRGQCLVHRAEILQFHGAWSDAMVEAERAYEHLSRPPGHPAVADALYRRAELLRLRGDLAAAEDEYRRASGHGREPQPGLGLLRLAQGQTAVAASAIRRAVDEAVDNTARAPLLAAEVEIALTAGDTGTARVAADELGAIATLLDAPVLHAIAAHASGCVLVAEGEAHAALAVLRPAWATFRDLEAPYEAARVRVTTGRACQLLGDKDCAALELAAAMEAFRQLGAVADLAALEPQAATGPAGPRTALTGREHEVLGLVATGMTNRAIAEELVISEKTVARHVANIFTKLGVSSRTAAAAHAYEHGLVQRPYTE